MGCFFKLHSKLLNKKNLSNTEKTSSDTEECNVTKSGSYFMDPGLFDSSSSTPTSEECDMSVTTASINSAKHPSSPVFSASQKGEIEEQQEAVKIDSIRMQPDIKYSTLRREEIIVPYDQDFAQSWTDATDIRLAQMSSIIPHLTKGRSNPIKDFDIEGTEQNTSTQTTESTLPDTLSSTPLTSNSFMKFAYSLGSSVGWGATGTESSQNPNRRLASFIPSFFTLCGQRDQQIDEESTMVTVDDLNDN